VQAASLRLNQAWPIATSSAPPAVQRASHDLLAVRQRPFERDQRGAGDGSASSSHRKHPSPSRRLRRADACARADVLAPSVPIPRLEVRRDWRWQATACGHRQRHYRSLSLCHVHSSGRTCVRVPDFVRCQPTTRGSRSRRSKILGASPENRGPVSSGSGPLVVWARLAAVPSSLGSSLAAACDSGDGSHAHCCPRL
jgi:hypothetical protein